MAPREVELELSGPGGTRRAVLALPPGAAAAPAPGVIVAPDGTGCDAGARAALRRLADAGYAALAPDSPAWLADAGAGGDAEDDADAEWRAFAAVGDRAELAWLEAALDALAARPEVDGGALAVVGLGGGGTLALLLGCASTRLGAVVDLGGRVVYPELSAAKPVQPLELALNLGAPVLGLFGADDPATPAADRDVLRDRLTQFAVRCEVHALPEGGHGFSNPSRRGYHEPSAREAWERILRFLGEELAVE